MRKHSPLVRQLLVVNIVGLLVAATIVVTLAAFYMRRIDDEVMDAARSEAFVRLESLEKRFDATLVSTDGSAGALALAAERFQPVIETMASGNAVYDYAMVLSEEGLILAHSDRTRIRTACPHETLTEITPGRDEHRHATLMVWGDKGVRVVDCAVPVIVANRQRATLHVGLSQPALASQVARHRRWATSVLALAGLTCLVVFATIVTISAVVARKSRQLELAEAHRDHLAEVGELADGLAHEIRNPLNAMRMQIAVLRNRLVGDDAARASAREQTECLEHEVLRLRKLASDFLAFGRPASHDPERLRLVDVLRNVADFVTPELEPLGVRVELAEGESADALEVEMERDRLRQILINLVENAKHAMSDGGRLTMTCERAGHDQARIEVRDTGCGIATDELKRVFDAFYSTRDEGTGLGLATAKRTVEAAGGQIHITSEPGQGTAVEIRLPVAKSSHAGAAHAAAAPQTAEAGS